MRSSSTDPRLATLIPWGTLRLRLTLLNTAVAAIVIGLLLLAVRAGVRAALFRTADDELRAAVRETSLALREIDDLSLVVDALRRKSESHTEREWFVQLLDGAASTVWASDNCPDELRRRPVDETVIEKIDQVGGFRWARRRVGDAADRTIYVRIGMSTTAIDESVRDLLRFLIPIGAGFLLLTPVAGYWLALRATRPIADILETAGRLEPTRLGDRLPARGTADELDRLSSTINRLLDDVAGHVERQQRFVADAAHELRGPLAAIQNSLEVAGNRARSPEAYRTTIEDVLGETRHLSKLANDLLLLAEMGEADGPTTAEACDLDDLARQTVSMFSGVAEERRISLEYRSAGRASVSGDRLRLRQVISNLIDNAIRFTPAGGTIVLSIQSDSPRAEAVLAVADDGRGIAPEQAERVFDRFYQADDARDRGDQGRGGGLGLPICRSIVERHGGTIAVTSPGPGKGTTVTVRLPLRRAA
jgi:heavy metal sensor kinase